MENQFNIGDTVYCIYNRFGKIEQLRIYSIKLKDNEICYNDNFSIKYDKSEIEKKCYTYRDSFYSKNQEILKEFFCKARIAECQKYIEDRKKDISKFEAEIREYYQKLMTINN